LSTVGVLALQGGVEEHWRILEKLGCKVMEIRTPGDLDGLSAIFLPGGESRTLMSLMNRWGLTGRIREMGLNGLPLFGTCAGAVLLSREVDEKEHEVEQQSLGLADVRAIRNYFGRQTSSFVQTLGIKGLEKPFKGIFIRAPLLQPLSGEVEILCEVADGPVLMRQDNVWLASFHPELTTDPRIHRLFLREEGILKGGSDAHL
jgi:pyridoxal 5'-phosphate synthase pdxT subunit